MESGVPMVLELVYLEKMQLLLHLLLSTPATRKKTAQEKIQQRLRTQQHLSKRKELKKQLRKQQANDRKRQQAAGIESDEQSSPSDDAEVIIVKDIGCLSI